MIEERVAFRPYSEAEARPRPGRPGRCSWGPRGRRIRQVSHEGRRPRSNKRKRVRIRYIDSRPVRSIPSPARWFHKSYFTPFDLFAILSGDISFRGQVRHGVTVFLLKSIRLVFEKPPGIHNSQFADVAIIGRL